MTTRTARFRTATRIGFAAIFAFAASQVHAHAKLVSTTPKADSTVSSPQTIQVHFNEAIEVKLSSLKLIASDGSEVAIMSMNDAKDPATLSIMPNAKLKPGVYTAAWSIVSDDGHKETGTFKFTVQ
jgi:methionine-rich copper-binding protein CopC